MPTTPVPDRAALLWSVTNTIWLAVVTKVTPPGNVLVPLSLGWNV